MTGGPDGNPTKARRWSPNEDCDGTIIPKSDRLAENGDLNPSINSTPCLTSNRAVLPPRTYHDPTYAVLLCVSLSQVLGLKTKVVRWTEVIPWNSLPEVLDLVARKWTETLHSC